MSEAFKIEDIFAENVFTVAKMKERLPKKVFANLKNNIIATALAIKNPSITDALTKFGFAALII